MTVTETKPGTMAEVEGRSKVSPSSEVKTPEAKEKVSSEEERIYTQSQHDALVHAIDSEWGRKFKTIEAERDTLKSQITKKESEYADIQADIEALEKKLDDMSSGDPEKFSVIKELKEARRERADLKAKLSTLDDREKNLSEREKKVTSFEREVLIETISDEYEDGDSEKLKKAIGGFENPTEEQIRNIAEILWTKKEGKEEKKAKAPKPYSGKSEGGTPYFTRAQIADREFWGKHREEILKAQAEGRIKNE